MTAIRLSGTRGLAEELISPGDTMLLGEFPAVNTTVGSASIPAAQLLGGALFRSGSVGAYTDTLDTAINVLAALAGNGWASATVLGHSFKLRYVNTVAFVDTITLGAGMVAGQGTIASIPASNWRDFLFRVLSVQQPELIVGNTTNGSAAVTFTLQPGQVSLPFGPSVTGLTIMPGCSVSGTGIPAGTTVIGITQGQGGVIGCTLSANATATNANVTLTFGPTIEVSSTGSGAL